MEKKQRVPEGEQYLYIDSTGIIEVDWDECRPCDDKRFDSGNYFHTQEEAESMARKIRAVLKGADVVISADKLKGQLEY